MLFVTDFAQSVTVFSHGWEFGLDPDEIGTAFHWAPIARSSFNYGPVYDGISASLQQAGYAPVKYAPPRYHLPELRGKLLLS